MNHEPPNSPDTGSVEVGLQESAATLGHAQKEIASLRKSVELAIRYICLIIGVGIGAGAMDYLHKKNKGTHPQQEVLIEIPDIPKEAFAILCEYAVLPDATLQHLKKVDGNAAAALQIKPLLDAYAAKLIKLTESQLLYMTEHESEKLTLWRAMPFDELYASIESEKDDRYKAVKRAIFCGRLSGLSDFESLFNGLPKNPPKEEDKEPPKSDKRQPSPPPLPRETTDQLARVN